MVLAIALGIARLRRDAHRLSRHVGQPDLVEERPALRGDHGQLGPEASPTITTRPTLPPPQLTYKDADVSVQLRHPGAQGRSCTRLDGVLTGGSRAATASSRAMTRVTTADFFADVRRAVPVRQRLGAPRPTAAPQPVIVLQPARRTRSCSAASTASAARSAGTTASSASSACSMTGTRSRSSTTSTTARSTRPRTSTFPSAGARRSQQLRTAEHRLLEARGARHLQGLPRLRLRLDPDVGRAADAAQPRAHAVLPGRLLGRAAQGRPLPAAAQQPPDQRRPVAADQRGRRQRQPRAGRPRVRVPRGLPDQHRRPAARQVPERRRRSRGVRRALGRQPPPDLHCSTWSRSARCRCAGALLGLALARARPVGPCGTCTPSSAARASAAATRSSTHFDVVERRRGRVVLAVVATLAAGLYPAWRVGRLPPAGT